jgi:DNA-binding PadR family transcriptional regulator
MQSSWPAENILLGLLCERPMHGYEIAQVVRGDEALRAIWRIERSEIYFLLGKLKQRAFITEAAEERLYGPARTTYAPTDNGRAALEEWLRTPELRPRNLRTALLARVWLALRREPADAVALIDAQVRTLSDWLDQAQQQKFENEVVALVHQLRQTQVRATLDALDQFRRLAVARGTAHHPSET